MKQRRFPIGTVIGILGAIFIYAQMNSNTTPQRELSASQLAYTQQSSGVAIEDRGTVVRLMEDDNREDRLQRFVVRLMDGHRVLLVHNVEIARRVPVSIGDRVQFSGRYEWSDDGGYVRWTHKDPDGIRLDGWVEHQGRRYE